MVLVRTFAYLPHADHDRMYSVLAQKHVSMQSMDSTRVMDGKINISALPHNTLEPEQRFIF